MAQNAHRQLAFAILEYLNNVKSDSSIVSDSESIEVACQCISEAFAVDFHNEKHAAELSIKPDSLLDVFARRKQQDAVTTSATDAAAAFVSDPAADASELQAKFESYNSMLVSKGFYEGLAEDSQEYKDRYNKARSKFFAKFGASESGAASSAPATPATPPTAEAVARAEALKAEGNQKLTEKSYDAAVRCYTDAIALNPNNCIYYSNRAAAYTHLLDYDAAVADCRKSISIDPSYSKAHSRLGLVQLSQGKYADAVVSYKRALELDPASSVNTDNLRAAEEKLRVSQPAPAAAGMPDPSSMMNMLQSMMGGAQPGGAAGSAPSGMPDMSQLFSNPAVMNMAAGMMGQPAIQQMMRDPNIMNMAQSMMSNPAMMNTFMQAAAGGNGDAANELDDSSTP